MPDPTPDFAWSDGGPLDLPDDAQLVEVPAGLAGAAELHDVYFQTLQLPGYFGWNWDALEECLRDLLVDPQAPPLAVLHVDVPLADKPDERNAYLQLLRDLCRESARQGLRRFLVVFPRTAARELDELEELDC